MRVLVCGGRDFADRAYLFRVMDKAHAIRPITTVIEGGAAGADKMARAWADRQGIEVATFHADWELYGNRAGPVRNRKMLREGRPDLVIAFKGGRGTADMVAVAAAGGVKVVCTWNYKDSTSQSPNFHRPASSVQPPHLEV